MFTAHVEVSVDDDLDLGLSHALTLLARLVCELTLEQKHHAQVAEEYAGDLRLAAQCFEKIRPRVALILCSR